MSLAKESGLEVKAEEGCYICLLKEPAKELVTPCKCAAPVHSGCMDRFQTQKQPTMYKHGLARCEMCGELLYLALEDENLAIGNQRLWRWRVSLAVGICKLIIGLYVAIAVAGLFIRFVDAVASNYFYKIGEQVGIENKCGFYHLAGVWLTLAIIGLVMILLAMAGTHGGCMFDCGCSNPCLGITSLILGLIGLVGGICYCWEWIAEKWRDFQQQKWQQARNRVPASRPPSVQQGSLSVQGNPADQKAEYAVRVNKNPTE